MILSPPKWKGWMLTYVIGLDNCGWQSADVPASPPLVSDFSKLEKIHFLEFYYGWYLL